MKVISVIGYSNTGKTTTIEAIIRELKKRKYSVGTVKCSHHRFSMDTEGKNTYRHKKAGADLVTARSVIETAILWPGKMDIYQLLQLYNQDYVIIEGESGVNAPTIVTGDSNNGIEEKLNNRAFLISGKIADEIDEYNGIKAISALKNIEGLVDFIEEKTFELLPDYKEKCCNLCGYNCKEMCELIIKGEKSRKDCLLCNENIKLKIDGKEIEMVPFVQNILRNTLLGVVGELEGYRDNSHVQIEFGVDYSNGGK